MKKPSLILKGLILLLAIGLVAAVIFVISVLFFYFLVPISLIGFVVVIIGEWRRVFAKSSWLKYLCWAWIVLITPTFGIMPLLLAPRLHYYLPMGNTLGIFTGFTYTYIYDFFIPTPELFVWDHPFPPVTNMQLYSLGCITILFTLLPSYIDLQGKMRLKKAISH